MEIGLSLIAASALLWFGIVILPWRSWSSAPSLDATASFEKESLDDITVLIPARNEAAVIERTLDALVAQGDKLSIIVVDDESTDGTRQAVRQSNTQNLVILPGKPTPPGWSGKLWALEQGRCHIHTPLTLLLDADIELRLNLLHTLREFMKQYHLHLVSLVAAPCLTGFWEKLLMPAFIYFFKLLYPFRLSNSSYPRVAAAAGGCILLETRLLEEIGGFTALRDALIDDCTLARRIKSLGYKTWIGLTHSAHSLRSYQSFRQLWNMVARTAFTQLHYSIGLLGLCTLLMVLAFGAPLAGLVHTDPVVKILSLATLTAMLLSYVPILRFYGQSPAWALLMPLIGVLYLAMTWSSAIRYWGGERARWKGRRYGKEPDPGLSHSETHKT